MRQPAKLTIALLLLLTTASAQDRSHARSMVVTRYGIVATSHVQASRAGAEVLERGGSAVDAAIAANAVLGVTEPMANGIGGDLFALYWDAKAGKLYALNASGWAPRALTVDHLKAKSTTSMPQQGIDSATVPGAVAGWAALHKRFGRITWPELFRSAIFYAESGYPVPELIHAFWAGARERVDGDPESRRVFLPRGSVPAVGDVFRNPDLAGALRLIAASGDETFYRGEIARAIVSTSEALGGTIALNDLAEFSPEWVEPISTTYRGWTVYEIPPNGQGMAALEMLNIMETTPASPEGPLSVAELHKKIEAMKLAYADLERYNADLRFAHVPVRGLLSKEYAIARGKLIAPDRANCTVASGVPPSSDTTYLSTVDRDGNIVSLIQSNYSSFGSGIAVRGMGFVLQNRGGLFSLDPEKPQCPGAKETPLPHDHSRVHGKRRSAHRLRHHGRSQPAAGARAVRVERRRLRDEHPGGNGSGTLHRQPPARMPHRDRVARVTGREDQADGHGPRPPGAQGVLDSDGSRPGRPARRREPRELRRVGRARRRRGRTREPADAAMIAAA